MAVAFGDRLEADWALARRVLERLHGRVEIPPLDASPEDPRAAAFRQAFYNEALRLDPDPARAERAYRMATGLGLLEGLLAPEVEEVVVRGGSVRVIYRDGRREDLPGLLPPEATASLIRRLSDLSGRSFAAGFLTTDLPRPGLGRVRAAAVLDAAAAPALNLRLFPPRPYPLAQLAADYGIPPEGVEALRVLRRTTGGVLIAGPFAAGKTTLLNAVLLEAAEEGQMVAAVEAFRELVLPPDRVLQVEIHDPEGMDRAIAEAVLRMRADLLAVGEITAPPEARRFLWVASVGRSAWATIHGGRFEQAAALLMDLCVRAGMSEAGAERMRRAALQAVVMLDVGPDGRRRFAGIFDAEGRPWRPSSRSLSPSPCGVGSRSPPRRWPPGCGPPDPPSASAPTSGGPRRRSRSA